MAVEKSRPLFVQSNLDPTVSAFLFGIIKNVPKDFYFEVKKVNGQPAIVIYMNGKVQSIISFYISNDTINEMYITMNPDKLSVG